MSEVVNLAERQPRGSFVCTGCGTTRESRASLERHWTERPDCKASLSRPIGQFDGPKERTPCCEMCHDRVAIGLDTARPCPHHAYRGCPGC